MLPAETSAAASWLQDPGSRLCSAMCTNFDYSAYWELGT